MGRIGKIFFVWLSLALILGTHRGYLALWKEGFILPLRVYPYKTETLPPPEVQKLEAGITIRDEDHLHSLLSDYLS